MSLEDELIEALGAVDCIVTLTTEGPVFIIYTSNVDRVKEIFRRNGMVFAVRHSKVNPAERLMWTCKDINYFGTPFMVSKRTSLECKYGMRRKPADRSSVQLDESGMKKRTRLKPSKKTGCPAIMKITEIVLYPEYAMDPAVKKNVEYIKETKMRELRRTLKASGNVAIDRAFIMTVSKPSEHNHSVVPTLVNENSEVPTSVTENSEVPTLVTENSEVPTLVTENSEVPTLVTQNPEVPILVTQNLEVPIHLLDSCVIQTAEGLEFGYDDEVRDFYDLEDNASIDSRSYFPTKEIVYNHDLELESNFSQNRPSQLRETAKSILDLTYLIPPEAQNLSQVQELLSRAERILKRKLLGDENEIAPTSKICRM